MLSALMTSLTRVGLVVYTALGCMKRGLGNWENSAPMRLAGAAESGALFGLAGVQSLHNLYVSQCASMVDWAFRSTARTIRSRL